MGNIKEEHRLMQEHETGKAGVNKVRHVTVAPKFLPVTAGAIQGFIEAT